MPQASTIERSGTAAGLSLAALILLGTRFTQGFIFWGGATRRLIYDFHSVDGVDKALKLDFDAPGFVAAKLTHALPGALWVQGPIEWTLRHPDLIVASVWLWTFAELAIGLGLMLGLATRLAAFGSFWLNVVLMLIFGWMGSTCLDEWTMAVSGVAMSSAVFLAGGGVWSLGERYIAPTGWAQRMRGSTGSAAGRCRATWCPSSRCGSAACRSPSRWSRITSSSARSSRLCTRA
jgi:thiosulfate dehydrogenase (quinone)